MADKKALAALRRSIGSASVLVGEDDRFAASLDNMRLSFMPDAVIKADSVEQIYKILRIANRYAVPVTTRGSGTGTTGAAVPVHAGWALDCSSWTKFSIDDEAGQVTTEPGATPFAINQAAEAKGWFYPPDPSSLKYASIGGNIATNAGGMRGAKYGVTRDYVLALEAVTPTGELVKLGAPLRKFAAGYNLRDLLIGSEGTLGVITSATLRLVPKPEMRTVLLAGFSTEKKALRVVRSILRKRIVPSVMEFIDQQTTSCHLKRTGKPIFAEHKTPALLLIEIDGRAGAVASDTALMTECLQKEAFAVRVAGNQTEADAFFQVRRTCSQAMFELGDTKLNEDIVVPVHAYAALIDFTLQLKKEIGLATPTFGHAADGNFHVHIMFNRQNEEQRKLAEKGIFRIMEKVVELGGAISGEHGIGIAKSPFLRLQHSQAEIDMMQAIKKALDPNGILNPGKIFDPVNVWDYEPVKVRLAWDH